MPEAQTAEYLNEAIKASRRIQQISEQITEWEAEVNELEEKHGITPLKKQIREAKKTMELIAYETVNAAEKAKQGKLFEEGT